jgi:hypothetical protein
MKIKLSKSQWQHIGKTAGWIKRASEMRFFNWEDMDGKKWVILYMFPVEIDYELQGIPEPLKQSELAARCIDRIESEDGSIKITKHSEIFNFVHEKINAYDDFFSLLEGSNQDFSLERAIEKNELRNM